MKKNVIWLLLTAILLSVSCTKDETNSSPVVEIISPLNRAGVFLNDTLQIMAQAADPDGKIKDVLFYFDKILAGSDSTEPFEIPFIVNETGDHVLIAKAIDNLGSSTYSDSVEIHVSEENLIEIHLSEQSHNHNYIENDTVRYGVFAISPDDPIIRTSLYVNNNLLQTDSVFPYTFQWNTVPAGEYIVYATAEAESGKTGRSGTRNLIVKTNTPPTVEITYPTPEYARFMPGQTIRISVHVQDPDNNLAFTEFFNNDVLLGSTNKDDDFFWQDAHSGTHSLKAKTYDKNGGSGISEPVQIEVTPGIFCDGVISELTASEDDNLVFGLNQTKNTLLLINPETVSHSQIELPYPQPLAMDYSIQDQKLYIVYKFSGTISVFDRTTNNLSEINFSEADDGRDICVDPLHRRIYVMSTAGIYILDMDNGTILQHGQNIYEGSIVINPDERYLYYTVGGLSPSYMRKYSVIADTLNLITTNWRAGSNPRQINIHPDGNYVVLPCGGGNGPGYTVYAFDPENLNNVLGEFDIGTYPTNTAFSHDGNIMLGTNGDPYDEEIYIMDAHAYTQIDKKELPHASDYCRMTTNHSGNKIIAFTYDEFYEKNFILFFYNL